MWCTYIGFVHEKVTLKKLIENSPSGEEVGASFTVGYRRTLPGSTRRSSLPIVREKENRDRKIPHRPGPRSTLCLHSERKIEKDMKSRLAKLVRGDKCSSQKHLGEKKTIQVSSGSSPTGKSPVATNARARRKRRCTRGGEAALGPGE